MNEHARSPAALAAIWPAWPASTGTMRAMLTVSWDTIRLFLHVLAATVWVGGQITLAALFLGILLAG
jgi:hypothetical protein